MKIEWKWGHYYYLQANNNDYDRMLWTVYQQIRQPRGDGKCLETCKLPKLTKE